MPEIIKTQISGKFSKEDMGIFQLKQKLIDGGIIVEFPFGNEIIEVYQGIPVTFHPEPNRSFYDVELEFFTAIRTNPVHIAHNKYGKIRGYLGKSASIETAYAILHQKPIVFLYQPTFSDNVPASVRKFILQNKTSLLIARIDLLPPGGLLTYTSKTINDFHGKYNFCDVETEIGVMETIADLFKSYKST